MRSDLDSFGRCDDSYTLFARPEFPLSLAPASEVRLLPRAPADAGGRLEHAAGAGGAGPARGAPGA